MLMRFALVQIGQLNKMYTSSLHIGIQHRQMTAHNATICEVVDASARVCQQRVSWCMQVLMTVTCELITPKQVVPGTLKIVQGHLHFTGDAPDASVSPTGVDATSSHPTRVRTCDCCTAALTILLVMQGTHCVAGRQWP